MDRFLSFAYGSNMCSARLLERCPSALSVGMALLSGYRLTFFKVSTDGSGKCDIEHTGNEEDLVWGVVFSILNSERAELDRFEGLGYGYESLDLSVQIDGKPQVVSAYIADIQYRKTTIQPYHWYKNFVVCGAIEHKLPKFYIDSLQAVISKADSDVSRVAKNEAICPKL